MATETVSIDVSDSNRSLQSTQRLDVGDDVADAIDFRKLLQPSSSDYYYQSGAVDVNRQVLDQVTSKKTSLLDLSAHIGLPRHSRASMLSERLKASSYRGPAPRKKDGSIPKSSLKRVCSEPLMDVSSVEGVAKRSLSEQSVPASSGRRSEAQAQARKECTFSCVHIREYERVAGDNPCVSTGVPLSISWRYYQHDSIDLGEYECKRGPPRDKIEMMVPPDVRRQMLDEFGVSISDMNAAMREVSITKKQRRNTEGAEAYVGLTEAAQSAKRKFRRLVRGTSTGKEQEMVWLQAQESAQLSAT